jgi:hypothetical protein
VEKQNTPGERERGKIKGGCSGSGSGSRQKPHRNQPATLIRFLTFSLSLIQCDNQRPFCRKCIDGGRECAGYERETVFIIGTIEDQGRCSSHPPRVVKPRRGGKATATAASTKAAAGGSNSNSEDSERLFELTPKEPLRPAWDDLISVVVSSRERGKSCRLQIAALHIHLQAVTRAGADDESGKAVSLALPPYEPQNVQPGLGEGEFRMSSQCLVHLATPDEEQGMDAEAATESICLFLYEVCYYCSMGFRWYLSIYLSLSLTNSRQSNNSSYFSNHRHWKDPSVHVDAVRRMGPEQFRSFPNHHFFARVYRPTAVCSHPPTPTCLLLRRAYPLLVFLFRVY